MSKLFLISGLLLAPLAASGQIVVHVYSDSALVIVTKPPGQTALACYARPLLLIPPICSLPAGVAGLTVGDVEVYGGAKVKAVMQIATDENGNPLEQYFTDSNSAGQPARSTLLASLSFDGAGEALYFAGGVEFHLFDYAHAPATLSLSPYSLTFASLAAGSTSGAQSVTLTNTGTEALAVSSIIVGGANPRDFAETDTCGAPIAPGDDCIISLTFQPTGGGIRSAAVSITDDAAGSPQTIQLRGTAVAH